MMSSRIFFLLSPKTHKAIMPQNGVITQNSNTHPMALRPRFLAILAGTKIHSHSTTNAMTMMANAG